MIIDYHCHLEYEPLFSNLDKVISRANENDVKFLLTISTTDQSFDKIIQITKKYKNVYGTYGIHPHESGNYKNLKCQNITKKIKGNKKIIGIGETGLDFFYENSDRDSQIKVFIEHIKAAQETNLPLIVHTRSAEEETFNILKSELEKKKFKILIHCFTGSSKFASNLLKLNCFISASGIVTFKNSKDLANTFKKIPNDRILVETDSPYLSPDPLRGRTNEPSHITHTVKFLSKIKTLESSEFSKITTENFFNLFGELN